VVIVHRQCVMCKENMNNEHLFLMEMESELFVSRLFSFCQFFSRSFFLLIIFFLTSLVISPP